MRPFLLLLGKSGFQNQSVEESVDHCLPGCDIMQSGRNLLAVRRCWTLPNPKKKTEAVWSIHFYHTTRPHIL
jgi:hypothetical protein